MNTIISKNILEFQYMTVCCNLCESALVNKYFSVESENIIMYLKRFSEASFFPKNMRDFNYCPFCGKDINQHSPPAGYDCLPFKSESTYDAGTFVYRLENYKSNNTDILSFNLMSRDEYNGLTTGVLDMPRQTVINYCPYCGERLIVKNGEIKISFNK
jgi:hypothetical protein